MMDRSIIDVAPELQAKVAPEISCANCKHLGERYQFGRLGQVCLANPPQLATIQLQGNVQIVSVFPGVEMYDHCGAFHHKAAN